MTRESPRLCDHDRISIPKQPEAFEPNQPDESISFVLVPLTGERGDQSTFARLATSGSPWLGWNMADEPERTVAAYEAGAIAVFPANTPINRLLEVLRRGPHSNIGQKCDFSTADARQPERALRKGDRLILQQESSVDIISGVLAQFGQHYNGEQALLGLSGAGQLLLAHQLDDCSVEIVAHTDARVIIESWQDLQPTIQLVKKLTARIRQVEAWSAVRAQPYLDQRVLGLLTLLAESFGKPHPEGTLIDVKITHAMLASAVGANRTTVTRLLGQLRRASELDVILDAGESRFCLAKWNNRPKCPGAE